MRQFAVPAFLALTMLALPAMADDDKTPGRMTAELTFASIDTDGKGYAHLGDMERFRLNTFLSMDTDGDGRITYAEFSAWDPGFAEVAEAEGRPDAVTTATRIIFSIWDRNGNGALTQAEHRFAVTTDFRRADLDDDGTLTEAEFLGRFSMIVALRAAIRPDIEFTAD